jgi:2-methylcitrate dehydratase PrpD
MHVIAQDIAKFACSTDYKDIPSKAVENAKNYFLDCVGVTLAGSTDRNSRIITEFVSESGGKPESSVLGTRVKVPSMSAALANGVASHTMDYDDTSDILIGHPSVISCPPSLAVGEAIGATGRQVLAAYIIGGEVACRLGQALTDKQYAIGWHNTGTMGVFGSAVAAGKLLDLNEDQMAFAIGIAASSASGIKINFGTSCKSYHVGQACSSGVRAALLAKKGFTSSLNAIEGKGGLAQLLSGAFLADKISAIGKPYAIAEPGFNTKVYPSCAYTHSSMDAVLEIRRNSNFNVEDIVSVDCACSQVALDTVVYKIAQTALQGKFSMPFCVALCLLEGQATPSQFTDEKTKDPKVVLLEKKVTFRTDEEINARGYLDRGAKVKITLKNGKQLMHEVVHPKGDPENPLQRKDYVEKYLACAKMILSEDLAKESAQSLIDIENSQDIRSIVSMLSG